MPLSLPNLHNKSYDQLREEMLAAIIKYNKNWTNFNPSDPGITFLELICWFAENLLYRIDYIPEEAYINFLRLVAGASGERIDSVLSRKDIDIEYKSLLEFLRDIEPRYLFTIHENVDTHIEGFSDDRVGDDLKTIFEEEGFFLSPYTDVETLKKREKWRIKDKTENYLIVKEYEKLYIFQEGRATDFDEIKGVISRFYSSDYRAITKEDFEKWALKSTEENTQSKVRRAIVYEQKDLGKIEVIIVTDKEDQYDLLIPVVERFLNNRKLIGTWLEVKRVAYSEIEIFAEIIISFHAAGEIIIEKVTEKIRNFLDPISGHKGKGWPYKKSVNVYEISQLITREENILGVNKIYIDKNLIEKQIDGLVKVKNIHIEVTYTGEAL